MECGPRPLGNTHISSRVVRGHDCDLRIALRDRTQPKHGLLNCRGIFAQQLGLKPWTLLALQEAFELPHQIANERVASAAWQGDEYHDGARRVSWCGNDHDRAISIQIVRLIEAKVRCPIEPIVLESPWVDASSGCAGEAVVVDKTMLCRGYKHRNAGKVRYATDVIPVCVCQENITQLFEILARGSEPVGGWP